jgi:hypothetical protein
MQKAIETRWQKLLVTAAMCAVFVMAFAAPAFAIDYTDLTKPVTDELALVVPVVLAVIGAVLGVSWAIRFAVSKLRSAK